MLASPITHKRRLNSIIPTREGTPPPAKKSMYIYIYRERERVTIYIYIYIYISSAIGYVSLGFGVPETPGKMQVLRSGFGLHIDEGVDDDGLKKCSAFCI